MRPSLLSVFSFLLLPLLGLELLLRLLVITGPAAGLDRLLDQYGTVAPTPTLDAVFVGTSRVGAAIAPDAFAQALTDATGTPARAAKAWNGYSTLSLHYLGVRELLDANPALLDGGTVFVEAPNGLAEPRTWTDPWTRPEWPELLGPVLDATSAARYWRDGSDTMGAKIMATLSSVSLTARLWVQLKSRVYGMLKQGVEAVVSVPSSPSALAATTSPPIEADSPSARPAPSSPGSSAPSDPNRAAAVAEIAGWTRQTTARPPIAWEHSVLASLVQLVRQHGGRVVVYHMPLGSSGEAFLASTPTLVAEQRALQLWLRDQNVPYLQPSLAYSDADFPDQMHMRGETSLLFTKKLADAYLAAVPHSH